MSQGKKTKTKPENPVAANAQNDQASPMPVNGQPAAPTISREDAVKAGCKREADTPGLRRDL